VPSLWRRKLSHIVTFTFRPAWTQPSPTSTVIMVLVDGWKPATQAQYDCLFPLAIALDGVRLQLAREGGWNWSAVNPLELNEVESMFEVKGADGWHREEWVQTRDDRSSVAVVYWTDLGRHIGLGMYGPTLPRVFVEVTRTEAPDTWLVTLE